MITDNRDDLSPFEQALLAELKDVVRHDVVRHDVVRHDEAPPTPPSRQGRHARRYLIAAAAAAGVATFVVMTSGGATAYAIDEEPDGDVVVTIHELDDAAGLQQALADHGISADVNYDASQAQEPGIEPGLSPPPAEGTDGGGESNGELSAEEVAKIEQQCGFGESGPITVHTVSGDYVFTIPADFVAQDRQLAILTTEVDGNPQVSVEYPSLDGTRTCGSVSIGS